MICTGLTLYQKLASGSCRFPDVNNIHKEIQKMFGNEIYNQSLLVSEIAYPELFPDYLYKK